MKPSLLVLELWALGDLALASPFLQQASRHFEVTLIAKPLATELGYRLWPKVNVIPFKAPWTVFRGKYRLHIWPWRTIRLLVRALRATEFDLAVSARWDPRDHLLMWLVGAKRRIGFPRVGSQAFLTDALDHRTSSSHQFDRWQRLAVEIGIDLSRSIAARDNERGTIVLVHTGAGQAVRAWPLDRYRELVRRLRERGYAVKVLCDPDQLTFWHAHGESVTAPRTITELTGLLGTARILIGNDSGPGHLAAILGIPTFTIFGPQLPRVFAPIHPSSEWIEGSPCPYKPCFDSCRYSVPHCILNLDEETVWQRVEQFVAKQMPVARQPEPKLV